MEFSCCGGFNTQEVNGMSADTACLVARSPGQSQGAPWALRLVLVERPRLSCLPQRYFILRKCKYM